MTHPFDRTTAESLCPLCGAAYARQAIGMMDVSPGEPHQEAGSDQSVMQMSAEPAVRRLRRPGWWQSHHRSRLCKRRFGLGRESGYLDSGQG